MIVRRLQKIEFSGWKSIAIVGLLFGLLVFNMHLVEPLLQSFFPDLDRHLYDRASFLKLVIEHLLLVISSGILATLVGVLCGILVTRRGGRDFLAVMNSMASLGQTFPPLAVLALLVPMVGFGAKPTIVALFVYGLFPIVRNTIAGLESVPRGPMEAAQGMGMAPLQILARVEMPLSLPLIIAGIRTSMIINIGTATLGATIGAGGLGAPIVAGLIGENPAYVVQGAVLVGLLAILVDLLLGRLDRVEKGYGVR